MERPDPTNPHAKPYKDRATRRAVRPIEDDGDINGTAPRTTGQPHHIRQARFEYRAEVAAEVKRLGVKTRTASGKRMTLKQIRIAVAKARAAESRGHHPSMVIMDEETA